VSESLTTLSVTRRRLLVFFSGTMAVAGLAACQSPQVPGPAPTVANPLIKPKATSGAELTPVLASSELAIGRNRFAIGLIDAQNQPITAGQVHLEFFKLNGQTAEKRSEADAVFRALELQNKGIWVTPTNFDVTGPWGAQVTLTPSAAPPKVARLNFEVRERFSAPGYGDPAPRSASPTLRDVGGDASKLCSSQPPCGLHDVSIAEALQPAQKPLLVVFATPAFCTSALCGPELGTVLKLRDGYSDRVNFIHIEIYQYPFEQQRTAQTVDEWHLPSEPWVFMVDRDGVVRDRFEGSAPLEELEPALKTLV
jgi:hypothetical protein